MTTNPNDYQGAASSEYPPRGAVDAPPRSYEPPFSAMTDPRRKSPLLAGVLSLMPGLGQVYVGYYQRGFTHLLVVAGVITFLAAGGERTDLAPLCAIFLAFFWLYNMIDAVRRASFYNLALVNASDIELPSDLQMSSIAGSRVGGVAVMAVGVILLLNTRFEVSLAWLEEWWPVAVIAFGAYLFYKAMADSRRERVATQSDEGA